MPWSPTQPQPPRRCCRWPAAEFPLRVATTETASAELSINADHIWCSSSSPSSIARRRVPVVAAASSSSPVWRQLLTAVTDVREWLSSLRAPPLASSLTMAPLPSSEQNRALSLLEKVHRCCVEGVAATTAFSFQPFAVRDFDVEASSLDEVFGA